MNWPFGDLTPKSYATIFCDPPWSFKAYSDKGYNKSPQKHYDCMNLAEIKALPVAALAQRDAVLLLWCTGWSIARGDAQGVALAWGFEPKTEIIWRKLTPGGKPRWGTGYRARSMHEPILICTKGNPKFKAFPSCVDGIVGSHSEKPQEVYEVIRRNTSSLLWRCDLFSAGIERYGFEGWGESHRTDEARALRAETVRQTLETGKAARPGEGPSGRGRGASPL